MREREEIEQEDDKNNEPTPLSTTGLDMYFRQALILEVLLDIRDLLRRP